MQFYNRGVQRTVRAYRYGTTGVRGDSKTHPCVHVRQYRVFSLYVTPIGCMPVPAQRAQDVIIDWTIMARHTSRFGQHSLEKLIVTKINNHHNDDRRRQSLAHFLTLLFAYYTSLLSSFLSSFLFHKNAVFLLLLLVVV
jgi:hypothetical protein